MTLIQPEKEESMSFRSVKRKWWIVASVVLGSSMVFGVASAAIPSENVISGCYAKNSGTLRVIDPSLTACKSSESSLDWNVHGPKGEKGDQGDMGPQGPAGVSGARFTLSGEHTFTGFLSEEILSTNVPPGNYIFIATVQAVFDPTGSFALQCDVKDGSLILGNGIQSETAGGFNGWLTLTFTAGATVPAAGTEIGLWCRNAGTPTGVIHGAQLLTMKVGEFF